MRISRAGSKLLEAGEFARFLQALQFPRSLLHEAIADAVWGDLLRGEWDTAVFKAFKAVEEAVRTTGGYSDSDYGVVLMRQAFNPTGTCPRLYAVQILLSYPVFCMVYRLREKGVKLSGPAAGVAGQLSLTPH